MAYLIMERTFEHPLTDADQEENRERTSSCFEEYGVRWIHSYLSETRRRKICVFEASDAETVRQAFRMAGLSFERVWPAERLSPEPDASLSDA